MYVCPKIYIRRALSRKVTVARRSQTNRNVFSARLNRSVDKQRLMDQQRQLELYALPDRQPMEPTKYWRYMLTAAGASDKTRCRILNAL